MRARGGCNDAFVTEYSYLRCYAQMIINTNPGSVAVVQSESVGEPPHFKRIFICLQACAQGFMQGCRGIVGLDGCHLKGPFGGIMLGAVSLDANLQFFPLAYAIVEVEDKDSWAWFLTMLRDGVGENLEVRPWVLISDRQKVSMFKPRIVHCLHIWVLIHCLFRFLLIVQCLSHILLS